MYRITETGHGLPSSRKACIRRRRRVMDRDQRRACLKLPECPDLQKYMLEGIGDEGLGPFTYSRKRQNSCSQAPRSRICCLAWKVARSPLFLSICLIKRPHWMSVAAECDHKLLYQAGISADRRACSSWPHPRFRFSMNCTRKTT